MSLARQLLGTTRCAVLAALFLHPEAALHVRELARVTGASPGSLHRELRTLTALGLLERMEIGRQVHYRANRSCPVFDELAGLLCKTSGLADVLREALVPLSGRIVAAFIYGSMAAASAGPRSDVDVMVLGQAGFADVVRALSPVQEGLGREVNPTVMKLAEFTRRRKAGDGFVVALLREPKIWLIGGENELA